MEIVPGWWAPDRAACLSHGSGELQFAVSLLFSWKTPRMAFLEDSLEQSPEFDFCRFSLSQARNALFFRVSRNFNLASDIESGASQHLAEQAFAPRSE